MNLCAKYELNQFSLYMNEEKLLEQKKRQGNGGNSAEHNQKSIRPG